MRLNLLALNVSLLLIGQFFISTFLAILGNPVPISFFTYLLCSALIFFGLVSGHKAILNRNFSLSKEMLFFVIILASFFLQSMGTYPQDKLVLVCYLVFTPLVLIHISVTLSPPEAINDLKRYLKFFSYFSVWWAFSLYILGFHENYSGESRITFYGIDNPIWTSRYIAVFVIVLFFTTTSKFKLLFWVTTLVAVYLMIQTGTRSSFLAVAVALLLSFGKRVISAKTFFILIILIVFSYFLMVYVGGRLSIGGAEYSIIARTTAYNEALMYIANQPWTGYGFGNYSIVTTGVDERNYPHNLLIEIVFELGLFAGVLCMLYIFIMLRKKMSGLECLYAIFVFHLVNSFFSGDFQGNNLLFISGYILSGVYCSLKRGESRVDFVSNYNGK
ncbi:hypothetical protein CWC29_001120 [Pseudoalteromonas sp. S4498]|uniref:O-antigen ligase family protein n=1 Tax=Pseudoalteromonas galatheae TaxID=579562 RepID=UPI001109CE95|nr:O-antigen ligase family protein [Pseudoalteromonas galatheae]NKC17454.1 hypothetical protein [Pseudoalteromonas galatheae]